MATEDSQEEIKMMNVNEVIFSSEMRPVWFKLSKDGLFSSWEHSFAYKMGKYYCDTYEASDKQVKCAVEILRQAASLGYVFNDDVSIAIGIKYVKPSREVVPRVIITRPATWGGRNYKKNVA